MKKNRILKGVHQSFKNLIKGEFLSRVNRIKNLPFLIYISFLGLVIIHLSNSANKKVYLGSFLQEEVNRLTIKSQTIKFQLIKETQYHSISNKANDLGLYQDINPPILIMIDDRE